MLIYLFVNNLWGLEINSNGNNKMFRMKQQ